MFLYVLHQTQTLTHWLRSMGRFKNKTNAINIGLIKTAMEEEWKNVWLIYFEKHANRFEGVQ